MAGRAWVLVGASGSGKTSLARGLVERLPGLSRALTCTTRAPRPGETEGRDYRFLDREAFETLRLAGGLVEWTEYAGNRYGLPGDQFEALGERDLVCVLDEPGVRHLRDLLGDSRVQAIRLKGPDPELLQQRMLGRGSGENETAARLHWEATLTADRSIYDAELDTDRDFESVLADLVTLVERSR
jgi:guanylate kinase